MDPKNTPKKPSIYHKKTAAVEAQNRRCDKGQWQALAHRKQRRDGGKPQGCMCTHTRQREKRKSRECSPKIAGTHQVSGLDISIETSYIDQTMWMHDKTVFFQTP